MQFCRQALTYFFLFCHTFVSIVTTSKSSEVFDSSQKLDTEISAWIKISQQKFLHTTFSKLFALCSIFYSHVEPMKSQSNTFHIFTFLNGTFNLLRVITTQQCGSCCHTAVLSVITRRARAKRQRVTSSTNALYSVPNTTTCEPSLYKPYYSLISRM